MTIKKVAVIGAGIVGSSAAYFLSKEKDIEVTIFDEGIGQGTAAAAGIISPWLSRRRNKKWYRMVKEGAAFYPTFLDEVTGSKPIPDSVYKKVGTLLFKKNPKHLDDMLEIGKKRRVHAPEIGDLRILSPEEIREKVPYYTGTDSAVWAAGGARVGGKDIVSLLLDKAQEQGARLVNERAHLSKKQSNYSIQTDSLSEEFDSVVLAAAAWLPDLLSPLGYDVDIRPQKGQLVELHLENVDTSNWPVVMPEGEKDIIPFEQGKIIIGATHQDESGFNLTIEKDLLDPMIQEATEEFSTYFKQATITDYRAGTRAYTSDYAPFIGEVPDSKNLYAASGLGSTGLTAGPLVGKVLSQLALGQKVDLPIEDYPIWKYVQKTEE
jgi:glycine/D-amino acid oxidase-like deaminating enzyme